MIKSVFLDARLSGNSGIGRYIDSLLAEFARRPEWNYQWSLVVNAPEQCVGVGKRRITKRGPFSPIWQLTAPFVAPRSHLIWTPHWNHPILTSSRHANVVTVHDVMPLRFPNLYSVRDRKLFELFVSTAVRRDYSIITVSDFSKHEILSLFPSANVRVIPNGATPLPVAKGSERAEPAPYFLCVGNLKPHKNIPFAIRAFRLAKARGWLPEDMKLLVAGAVAGLRQADQSLLPGRDWNADVRLVEQPSDAELGRLYRDCNALLAPSLYEGFGLPVLEAMHFNRPVLCADIGPFREIANTSVNYFDPRDEESCAQSMRQSFLEAPLPPAHYDSVLERFTWARAAAAHHSLFSQLYESHRA